MALSDSWLKANNGKKRPAVQEVKDRDGLSVRVSPHALTKLECTRCDFSGG